MNIDYEPEIIFVPIHWYYWLLDRKQKRPDYKRITSMAILGDLYETSADKDGYIKGDFCLDGHNEGGIFLHEEITSVLEQGVPLVKMHKLLIYR